MVRRVIEGFRFLADMSDAERILAQDGAQQRSAKANALMARLKLEGASWNLDGFRHVRREQAGQRRFASADIELPRSPSASNCGSRRASTLTPR